MLAATRLEDPQLGSISHSEQSRWPGFLAFAQFDDEFPSSRIQISEVLGRSDAGADMGEESRSPKGRFHKCLHLFLLVQCVERSESMAGSISQVVAELM